MEVDDIKALTFLRRSLSKKTIKNKLLSEQVVSLQYELSSSKNDVQSYRTRCLELERKLRAVRHGLMKMGHADISTNDPTTSLINTLIKTSELNSISDHQIKQGHTFKERNNLLVLEDEAGDRHGEGQSSVYGATQAVFPRADDSHASIENGGVEHRRIKDELMVEGEAEDGGGGQGMSWDSEVYENNGGLGGEDLEHLAEVADTAEGLVEDGAAGGGGLMVAESSEVTFLGEECSVVGEIQAPTTRSSDFPSARIPTNKGRQKNGRSSAAQYLPPSEHEHEHVQSMSLHAVEDVERGPAGLGSSPSASGTLAPTERPFLPPGSLPAPGVVTKSQFVKRAPCPYCSRVFRSSSLARHIRSHTGERPHSCRYCPQKFTDSWTLTRHVRSVHRDVAQTASASSNS